MLSKPSRSMAENIIHLTSGLYGFMESAEATFLHGRQLAEDARDRLRQRAHVLAEEFAAARRNAGARVAAQLGAVSAQLKEVVAALEARTGWHPDLKARWHALGRQYEALRLQLKTARLPSLKPRNLHRNVFHASMGLGAVLLYELVLPRIALLAIGASITILFVGMDLLRRASPAWNERFVQRVFGKISRPREAHKVPSATWYVGALTLGTFFFPQHAIEVGALVLALGDPAASLAGKRWGRVKLVGEKSVAGSATLFAVGFAASALLLALCRPALGLPGALGVAAAAAAAGALVELVPVEDNFTVPLAAALVAALLL